MLRDGLNDAFSDAHSGWHTEDLVEKFQVTREAQDRWALRSQQRFASAQAAGHFKAQIAPVEAPGKKGPTQFDKDEANRPETTLDVLARLKPAFRPDGTITAGNAPGLNDAAAAVVLADEIWAEQRGLQPQARLVAYGIAAVEPGMFAVWDRSRLSGKRWSALVGQSARSSVSRLTRHLPPSLSWSPASSDFPRTSSMSRAAPSPTDIRSVPPARYSPRSSSTRCAAMASHVALSHCASVAARVSRWRLKSCTERRHCRLFRSLSLGESKNHTSQHSHCNSAAPALELPAVVATSAAAFAPLRRDRRRSDRRGWRSPCHGGRRYRQQVLAIRYPAPTVSLPPWYRFAINGLLLRYIAGGGARYTN